MMSNPSGATDPAAELQTEIGVLAGAFAELIDAVIEWEATR